MGFTTKRTDTTDYVANVGPYNGFTMPYQININTIPYVNVYIPQFHIQRVLMLWNNNMSNQITTSFIVPVNCERG